LPSYRYNDDFRVGAVLPESGVTYYEIPAEYRVQGYRYAYVNDHAVLVDPARGASLKSSTNVRENRLNRDALRPKAGAHFC
jgi:hypothetical protein